MRNNIPESAGSFEDGNTRTDKQLRMSLKVKVNDNADNYTIIFFAYQ
jgi:hypothetical protein